MEEHLEMTIISEEGLAVLVEALPDFVVSVTWETHAS